MKRIYFVMLLNITFIFVFSQGALATEFGMGLQTYFITPQMSVKIPLNETFTLQVSGFPWRIDGEDHSTFATRIILPMSGWDRENYRAYSAWGMVWKHKSGILETDACLTFGIEQKRGASEFAHSFEFGINWSDDGDMYPTFNYGYHYYF